MIVYYTDINYCNGIVPIVIDITHDSTDDELEFDGKSFEENEKNETIITRNNQAELDRSKNLNVREENRK